MLREFNNPMKTLSFLIILLFLSLLLSCKKNEPVIKLPEFANITFKVQEEIRFGSLETASKYEKAKEFKLNTFLLLSFVCYTGEKEISRVSMFDCNRIGANCTIRSDSIFIDFDRISGTKVGCNSSLGYYRSFLDTTTYIYRNDTLFLKSTTNDTLILLKHERVVQ